MAKIDELLKILKDGQWHGSSQIIGSLNISQAQLQQLIENLEEHDLIKRDKEKDQIKLNQAWKTLLIEENFEEGSEQEKAAVGTIIVPPLKSILIQCTNITNLTDTSLELAIRIDSKLREIAINRLPEN